MVDANARPHVSSRGARQNVAVIFAAIALLIIVAAIVNALVVDPPALGWIGFTMASGVAVGLGAAAVLLLPRMRVSGPEPAVAVDQDRRLLVIADASSSPVGLADEVQSLLDGAVAVHLVVPVRVSHLHFLANDESEERQDAEQTMSAAVGLLRRRGVSATGSVGTDKPLESMTDALGAFPATDVLLAVPPADESYWLERDLLAHARALIDLPITEATVISRAPGRGEVTS